jgi:methionine-rich copper-binding protein CopC
VNARASNVEPFVFAFNECWQASSGLSDSTSIKSLGNLILLFATLILFTSCGDSHDKLAKDQVADMKEMTEILNDVADGKLSSAEATVKIQKRGRKGESIQTRKKALLAKTKPGELEAMGGDMHHNPLKW